MTIDEIQKAARDRIAEIDAQTAALAVEKAKLQAMLGGGTSVVEQILKGIGDGGRVDLQGPQWIPPLTIKPIPEQWVCGICKRSDCVGTHVICSAGTFETRPPNGVLQTCTLSVECARPLLFG